MKLCQEVKGKILELIFEFHEEKRKELTFSIKTL